MAEQFAIDLPDIAATRKVAHVIAGALPADACIALDGDLGAGKTTFVKALAESAGIDPAEVHSPTFGLVHVHDVPSPRPGSGAVRLVHVDAYRLSDPGDLASIGWEEIERGPGWLVVEWADRIASCLPVERLAIRIEVTGLESRRLVCHATGSTLAAVLDAVAATRDSAKLPPRGA
jgi:tRNA threonylcarbamoyladenosine biosynthesis protein TsaE